MDAEETEQLAQLYESKMEDAEYGHQEPWEMAAKISALEAEMSGLKAELIEAEDYLRSLAVRFAAGSCERDYALAVCDKIKARGEKETGK